MRKPFMILPLALTILLAFTACNQDNVYSKKQKLGDKAWDKDEIFEFTADIDEAGNYQPVFVFRHHTAFAPPAMDVDVEVTSPSGETMNETFTVTVKDEEGEFLSDGAGDYWDLEQEILNDLSFDEPGAYHFQISHPYNDRIPLVLSVGLKIKKERLPGQE